MISLENDLFLCAFCLLSCTSSLSFLRCIELVKMLTVVMVGGWVGGGVESNFSFQL